jgi:hypothetical protein
MNTTTLIRVEEGKYTDQYGCEHDAYRVVERVEVEYTTATYDYEYYHETIRNPIYRCDDRTFICMVATDFGCSASWHERVGVECVFGWHEERASPMFIGRKPVILLTDR